ncbi:hypothetical protein [Pistricoccus aurantiacus]|uniref:hypothetical protein n=1 Tax=Pistricoccus aurantiacus TaxID=1883414 RepID=UPI0036457F41
MNDDVVGVHRLLGLQLRDQQQGRQGTILGINHTRRSPALLIRWAGNSGIEWVDLSIDELDALIAASERSKSAPRSSMDSFEKAEMAPIVASAGRH